MKRSTVTIITLLLISTVNLLPAQQTQWQSLDGPWYAAYPKDIALGYKGGQRIIYVADSTANSLLKSTNDGADWIHLSISNPLAVACLPSNADILYVGRLDEGGVGMWKSTNGGETFLEINTNFTNPKPSKIAVSPHDENLIYVGCYKAADAPTLFTSSNGGSSWNRVPPFNDRQLTVTSIIFDAADSQRIWIAGYDSDPTITGVWLSTDAGNTWLQKVKGIGNTEIGSPAIDRSQLKTTAES